MKRVKGENHKTENNGGFVFLYLLRTELCKKRARDMCRQFYFLDVLHVHVISVLLKLDHQSQVLVFFFFNSVCMGTS